jgi:hypothetical protein
MLDCNTLEVRVDRDGYFYNTHRILDNRGKSVGPFLSVEESVTNIDSEGRKCRTFHIIEIDGCPMKCEFPEEGYRCDPDDWY